MKIKNCGNFFKIKIKTDRFNFSLTKYINIQSNILFQFFIFYTKSLLTINLLIQN